MKKLIIPFIVLLLVGCGNTVPIEKIVYVPVKDSTCADSLVYYKELLKHTQDSLDAVRDTTAEDLFIARYKLGRIKYYTNIVDNKSSQMKFYKGWIKRVLRD